MVVLLQTLLGGQPLGRGAPLSLLQGQICVCVCFLCSFVCVCVCMCAFVFVCVFRCVFVHVCVCMPLGAWVQMYVSPSGPIIWLATSR